MDPVSISTLPGAVGLCLVGEATTRAAITLVYLLVFPYIITLVALCHEQHTPRGCHLLSVLHQVFTELKRYRNLHIYQNV